MKTIGIDNRLIGSEYPPYIIAELSANHHGQIERAFKAIAAAKMAGADAVKIQTYTPDTITINCDRPDFQIKGGVWDGYCLYDLYEEAYTPYEWHEALFNKAKEIGITLFSTPFDETAVDLLERLNTPAYKIASFEMIDHGLLRYIAKTGKPIILSTGMANDREIAESIEILRSEGCRDLVVLHCISGYPTPIDQANVRVVPDIAERFGVLSGLSDHTLGITAAIAATVLGATVIEKHFTLSRQEKGPDSTFSLEPSELKTLCKTTREAWLSLGKVSYEHRDAEKPNVIFRRSLYVVRDIKKGECFTKDNVRSIRPGYGLAPKKLNDILGKSAASDIERGTALTEELIL